MRNLRRTDLVHVCAAIASLVPLGVLAWFGNAGQPHASLRAFLEGAASDIHAFAIGIVTMLLISVLTDYDALTYARLQFAQMQRTGRPPLIAIGLGRARLIVFCLYGLLLMQFMLFLMVRGNGRWEEMLESEGLWWAVYMTVPGPGCAVLCAACAASFYHCFSSEYAALFRGNDESASAAQ